MRHFDPVTALLTIIILAAGALLFVEPGSSVVNTEPPRSGANARAVPGDSAAPPLDTTQVRPVSQPNTIPPATTTAAASEPRVPEKPATDGVSGSSSDITIVVSGLRDQSSQLLVAVFDSAEGFPKPEYCRMTTTVPTEKDTVKFSLLLPDHQTTAIAVFQDLNGDGRLTKSNFGLPIEPYGFSNNARSSFGPPSFSKAGFLVSELQGSLNISVR
jgi:uncharacterized protein (DUF2141 family)